MQKKEEGTPTFCNSMDGTGEYYAKCNNPVGEKQIPNLTYKRNLMNKNKLMSKIEPEAWKHGIDWQRPEAWEEEDHGGKRGKGLVKEHVLMTHGHEQQCGN